tara:strand:+ start:3800 stop:5836 length:2037 start_codon:yes stop_codon:yes gene_type:complete
MAEIENTLGLKPKLKTYQSRPVTFQSPAQSREVNVPAVEQEMWNSVSQNFEKVFKIYNDSKVAAIDLEKSKQLSKMADHYSANEAEIMQNIKQLPDRDLDIGEYIKKYDEGNAGIKKYEFDDGLADQTVEQLEAMNTQSDNRSKDKIRQMLHQEAVIRTGDTLDNMANRTVSVFRNDLIQIENDWDEVKEKSKFHETMLARGKNLQANSLLEKYVDVLETKFDGRMMNEEEKKRRKYEYAQVLGNVLFEHYIKIDSEKALELARNRQFIVGGIPLDSTIVGKYTLNEIANHKNNHQKAKRNEYSAHLKVRAEMNPDAFINEWTVDGKTIRKSTPAEFNKIGRKYGFVFKENFDATIRTYALLAKGESEASWKEKQANEKAEDIIAFDKLLTGIRAYIKADDTDLRDTYLHKNFNIHEHRTRGGRTARIWMVKPEFADKISKQFKVPYEDTVNKLQKEVNGIPAPAPGSGMGTTMFGQYQSALIDYHTKKLFVVNEGIMTKDPRKDLKTYKTWLLNDKERRIQDNIINGFEEIENFNTNNFLKKSSTTLINEWSQIKENQTEYATGQTSVAMQMVGARYESRILSKRIENLVLRPNQTFIRELKMRTPPPAYNDVEKKQIDDHYKLLGQARNAVSGVVSYLPEWMSDNFVRILSTDQQKELKEAERMKEAYKEGDIRSL